MDRRGALELSVGTIVILVLAMSMLIMGILLIKNIFFGGQAAVDLINDNLKSEINDLFNEEDNLKIAVYLPSKQADVKPGLRYNTGFAIRNSLTGGSINNFMWEISADLESIFPADCRNKMRPNEYIEQGRKGSIEVSTGSPQEVRVLMNIPDNAPLCSVTYKITVWAPGQVNGGSRDNPYDQTSFIMVIDN